MSSSLHCRGLAAARVSAAAAAAAGALPACLRTSAGAGLKRQLQAREPAIFRRQLGRRGLPRPPRRQLALQGCVACGLSSGCVWGRGSKSAPQVLRGGGAKLQHLSALRALGAAGLVAQGVASFKKRETETEKGEGGEKLPKHTPDDEEEDSVNNELFSGLI